MKRTAKIKPTSMIAVTLGLTLVMLGNIAVVSAIGSTAGSQPTVSVPTQVNQYLSTYRGPSGCFSGTVSPFTIQSTSCPNSTGVPPQVAPLVSTNEYLDCTTDCQSGTLLYPTGGQTDYTDLSADSTVPSNPSNTYYAPTTVSYWIGLQSCTSSCSPYLLQAGIMWGYSSTYNSKNPILFVEYAENTAGTTCYHTFCGNQLPGISVGNSVYFSIEYSSSTSYWTLYAQDSSISPCCTNYIVYYNSGNVNIPYTSMPYALTVNEGQSGTTSASYFPGITTFTDEVGEGTSGSYQLGYQTYWQAGGTGTSPTSTIGYSTYSCYAGTCASTSIAMS